MVEESHTDIETASLARNPWTSIRFECHWFRCSHLSWSHHLVKAEVKADFNMRASLCSSLFISSLHHHHPRLDFLWSSGMRWLSQQKFGLSSGVLFHFFWYKPIELQKLQNFRFKNLFWINSSCTHTLVYRGAGSLTKISAMTCHRDDSELPYFQVKMDSLNSGALRMWVDCCMREGRSSNMSSSLHVSVSGGGALCAVYLLWKKLCLYFFSHTVLQEIMKIYRTSCCSKAEEFAFGELALYLFPDTYVLYWWTEDPVNKSTMFNTNADRSADFTQPHVCREHTVLFYHIYLLKSFKRRFNP